MKIALGQMRVFANNFEKNFETIQSMVVDAKGKADVIVFPELCISGAYIGDKFLEHETLESIISYNKKIADLSDGIDIIWGNVTTDEGVYNTALVARNKTITNTVIKSTLCDSGVCIESRYFTAKDTNKVVTLSNGRHFELLLGNEESKSEDWTIRLNARHYTHDLLHVVEPYTVCVNAVGLQNNGKNVFVMDGGSYVRAEKDIYLLDDAFNEVMKIIDISDFTHEVSPHEHKLLESLLTAIRFFDEENLAYGPKWIVGISGGLDSSLSVALLTMALGKERVLGVTMPGSFTRNITKSNAYHLSHFLGFKLIEIPIKQMVDATVLSLNYAGYMEVEGLTHENIQARLRGHTLMSIASLENGVVVNNGNKIETALGYATMYGDAIGALSLLGDLDKLEVGKLALLVNEKLGKEMIPINLIPIEHETSIEWDFAPSAELSQDQFDPMKWGYHDYLIPYLMEHGPEKVLEVYLTRDHEEAKWVNYLDAYKLNDSEAFIKDLEWVVRTMRTAVFKRIQLPPLVKVASKSFGFDYLEHQGPQIYSKRYERMKEQILKQ